MAAAKPQKKKKTFNPHLQQSKNFVCHGTKAAPDLALALALTLAPGLALAELCVGSQAGRQATHADETSSRQTLKLHFNLLCSRIN